MSKYNVRKDVKNVRAKESKLVTALKVGTLVGLIILDGHLQYQEIKAEKTSHTSISQEAYQDSLADSTRYEVK